MEKFSEVEKNRMLTEMYEKEKIFRLNFCQSKEIDCIF